MKQMHLLLSSIFHNMNVKKLFIYLKIQPVKKQTIYMFFTKNNTNINIHIYENILPRNRTHNFTLQN